MAADIRTIGSQVVYENRWMRVREDAIERPDGSRGIYGVVEKPDFVAIAAVDRARGLIHLVEQYRYPVAGRYWEVPQGSWETRPDVPPEEVARAELSEETGIVAKTMTRVGELFLAYGYSSQRYHVFLAEDLEQGATSLEAEEADLVSRAFPLAEVDAMIAGGIIRDATTVAALGLIRMKGLL
ncbi:8-oxo-dGTP pyrophosphatase MutT, NUDIX family [Pleomorphomonas diazotrophica]|nr:NUDIX hydrolase [Pleomorphomonas diazotrophica]SFN11780.1 8-oxo-dGTP pyrophosphatase MutT, NUDIX family [Pleomorphomonas diazotrophica]